MSDSNFEVGQLVRHRASGKLAVVVDLEYCPCVKHTQLEHLAISVAKISNKQPSDDFADCEYASSGLMTVETDISVYEDVNCFSFELAKGV